MRKCGRGSSVCTADFPAKPAAVIVCVFIHTSQQQYATFECNHASHSLALSLQADPLSAQMRRKGILPPHGSLWFVSGLAGRGCLRMTVLLQGREMIDMGLSIIYLCAPGIGIVVAAKSC